jgi:hypothetical protein
MGDAIMFKPCTCSNGPQMGAVIELPVQAKVGDNIRFTVGVPDPQEYMFDGGNKLYYYFSKLIH